MMKMNKKRKKSGMNMDVKMSMAKSTKKGKAGMDMMGMDQPSTTPMGYKAGGAVSPRKKMAMGYAGGGMVESRGNGAARGKKTRIC